MRAKTMPARRSTIWRCAAALGAWLSTGIAACDERGFVAEEELEGAPAELVDAAQPTRIARMDRPDLPLPALDDAQRAAFERGDALFDAMFRAADGLGPLYVRASCASCHAGDGRGPGTVTRLARADRADDAPPRDTLLPHGDVVRPYAVPPATRALLAEPLAAGLVATHRLPPAVFGRGHMEAVDGAAIEQLAARAAARPGPIKGRIHWVRERVREALPGEGAAGEAARAIGRFGLKARIATLEAFTADALLGDMGITSPLQPHEPPNPDGLLDDDKPGVDVSLELVRDLAAYVRLLDLPERTPHAGEGARLFEAAQCATCHVPRLPTDAGHPIAARVGAEVAVYTDFLLHDMGDALADGVPDGAADGAASGREWRTAPLIGLRFAPALLHDGRARTVAEAIAAHESPGSEASASVARFNALSDPEREALLDFVGGL